MGFEIPLAPPPNEVPLWAFTPLDEHMQGKKTMEILKEFLEGF
jgi:hypothetical protein